MESSINVGIRVVSHKSHKKLTYVGERFTYNGVIYLGIILFSLIPFLSVFLIVRLGDE